MKLLFVKNNDIDYKKWDETISKSYNGSVYAFSWYLDIVCKWNAIISDDYKYLMPIPFNKKLSINYVYTPVLIQQLGIFSENQINSNILNDFLNIVKEKYRYFELKFNKYINVKHTNLQLNKNITYELDLIQKHNEILKKYKTNTKRNLKKAEKANLTISKKTTVNELLILLKDNLSQKIKELNNSTLNKIKFIISQSSRKNLGEIIGIYDKFNNLISAAFFITSHKKSIMLILATTEESKKTGANFLLIDYFIKNNSGKQLTLDFEGSNIESLARFYASFGAQKNEYYTLKYNKLPFYLKFLKK